jgi:hypothetical protein
MSNRTNLHLTAAADGDGPSSSFKIDDLVVKDFQRDGSTSSRNVRTLVARDRWGDEVCLFFDSASWERFERVVTGPENEQLRAELRYTQAALGYALNAEEDLRIAKQFEPLEAEALAAWEDYEAALDARDYKAEQVRGRDDV